MRFFCSAVLLLATLSFRDAPGQARLPFPLDVPLDGVERYDEAISVPEDIIGHQIGTRHTEPHQVVEYFRITSENSDRVLLRTHGTSYEGRPLIHAIVTSPENHRRLEAIRQSNLRLSDSPGDVSDAEIEQMPVIIFAGYSIHGNEASGTEAALLLLYHLAAGEGPAVENVLRDAVVIVDPMLNPDGRGRFTTWVNRNRGAVPVSDPFDREHDEPWPGGRTNHYWFDLNRDWLPAQHPESQGRLEVFHSWRPQILTDHHEMGSEATFFFQPGIPSRNNPNTPPRTFELTSRLAEYHAYALDRIGSLYYTRESYDDFYYGKGSTYPDVHGAVGILFEQASSRALERETDRRTLTYAFTIRNQFVTSLSTLRGAIEMRRDLLRHQRDVYAGAPNVGREAGVRAYVVDRSRTPERAAALADLLRRHRIRIHHLSREVTLDGITFRPGEAILVPLSQLQARLAKAAMERVTTFEDSLFYDVSTWTLPLAFGLAYAEMSGDPAAYTGEEITESLARPGRIFGGRAVYAYVMEWGDYFAPRALYRLQNEGLVVRVQKEPFTAGTDGTSHAFGRGSIVIPVHQRDVDEETVHRLVHEAAESDRVDFYAVSSGLTSAGPDIGTVSSQILSEPRVALLTGAGASVGNAGEVWHLLSERFGFPVSLLEIQNVRSADLGRYNTIVMAGGSYSDLPADELKSWVTDGGRIVALTTAARWLIDNELLQLQEKPLDLDSLFRDLPFEALSRARGAHEIGGAILRANVDITHPVGYGFDAEVPVFRTGTAFYEPPSTPGRTVAVYAHQPLLSGYISAPMLAQAANSASIVADRYGQGRVTVFLDNPNFRAFWYGTNGLFLNAVFFGEAY